MGVLSVVYEVENEFKRFQHKAATSCSKMWKKWRGLNTFWMHCMLDTKVPQTHTNRHVHRLYIPELLCKTFLGWKCYLPFIHACARTDDASPPEVGTKHNWPLIIRKGNHQTQWSLKYRELLTARRKPELITMEMGQEIKRDSQTVK